MYTLCSNITIAGKRLEGVNGVEIESSIHKLMATATIKVPVTAVLRHKEASTYILTASVINPGDRVVIKLGYNGSLQTEFVGYVKQKNLCTPLEIVCEDEFYQTRSRSVTIEGKKTLSEILGICGLNVGYCVGLTVENFAVDNKPVSWVLGKLKTEYGLAIFFDMEGRIYASEPYKTIAGYANYRFRYNVIKDDDLTYQRADDVRLRIKAICIYRDGTKIEATIGSDGTEKTLYFYDVEDENQLAALAHAELKRYSYDGYSGKIVTFLQPYARPCMVANITDPVYPERDGRYYIESVRTEYGMSGARRNIEIGLKV